MNSDLPSVPGELRDAIENENLVIFVGAGLSINSGLPDWREIVSELLQENKDYISKADALRAALDSGIMSPLDILDKIEGEKRKVFSAFEHKLSKIIYSDLHSVFGDISRRFVTTNFDKLIESNANIKQIITPDSKYNLGKIDTEDEFVLKIHGDIDRVDGCVVFSSQYKKLYEIEQLSTFQLKKIFSAYTVLFVGFSFSDPYVTELFNYITNLQEDLGPKHFFISNVQEDIRNVEDKKIRSLECININDFSHLKPYVESLVAIKATPELPSSQLVSPYENTPSIYKDIDGSDIAPEVTGWVGRKDELDILRSNVFRVVFITGFGGEGKSALASYYLQHESDYEITEWKDFKEQDHKFQHKIISMIRRLNRDVSVDDLIGFSDSELIQLFFNKLGDKKAVFVLDNVDSYIDLENFEPTNGIGELFDIAMTTEHNSKFIFTCRPFIQYAKPRFMQLNLPGLSEDNTIEYFVNGGIGINKEKLINYAKKAYSLTSGHALWLSLILAQSRKGEKALKVFLDEIGTGATIEKNDTSIMSKNVLSSVWKSLHERDKQVLRTLAETVVAETEEDYAEILKNELNYKNFQKALRSLRSFNLIVEKRDSKYIELHPLVKQFVITYYPPAERDKYISYLVQYYDKWVVILKEKMSAKLSYQEFSNFINKAELSINAMNYQRAVSTLMEVQVSMCSAGYVEEFLRVSRLLFNSITWTKNSLSKLTSIETLIHGTAKASIEFGDNELTDYLIENYASVIEKKEDNYIRLCSIKSYYFWFNNDYVNAINCCEEALYLLDRAGQQPDNYSIKHHLALAQRDTKEKGNLDAALDFFIKDNLFQDLTNIDVLPENGESTTYGNVGKCLYYKGSLPMALTCYYKSFFYTFETENIDRLLNLGYAAYWIAEVLSETNQKEQAYYFFKYAFNCWGNSSPILASRSLTERSELLQSKQYKNIASQEDWRIEKFCVGWIENSISKKLNVA